jgi:hypothetical protein
MEHDMNWPLSRHVERQARRFQDMIARTDADPLSLVRLDRGDTFVSARKLCLECRHTSECLAWLARPKSDGERPSFCPNIKLLESVRRQP